MAGDWLKWCKGLARKPEVIGIAGKLGITRRDAASLCMEFWEWCDDNLSETDISDSGHAALPSSVQTAPVLDSLAGVSGFTDAMFSVGWLGRERTNGPIVVRYFNRHNGKPAKDRALTQLRVKRFRNAVGNEDVTDDRGKYSSLLFSSLDLFLSSKEVPTELRTDSFFELWKQWEKHRREIKKPLTATQVKAQLKMLGKRGLERATRMIEHTIEMGWQGLREPDDVRGTSTNRPSANHRVGPGQRFQGTKPT